MAELDYILGILRDDVRDLGRGVMLTNQDGIESKHLVCFLDSGGEFHFGFGYKNGNNFRVVCWENGERKNRTAYQGTFIIAFDQVTTLKGRHDNFTADDFNFAAWFDTDAQTLAREELLLAEERREAISIIIDGLTSLTIQQLDGVRGHINDQ